MELYRKYLFFGFDDRTTSVLATNLHSFIKEASTTAGTDFNIGEEKAITEHAGLPALGYELILEATHSMRIKRMSIVWFSSALLSDHETLIDALANEKDSTRLFFCFDYRFLEEGFDGLSSMETPAGNYIIANFLTDVLVNLQGPVQPTTLVYIENQPFIKPSFAKYQNQGMKLNGDKAAAYLSKDESKDYKSFSYFLQQPVLILNNLTASYRSLLY